MEDSSPSKYNTNTNSGSNGSSSSNTGSNSGSVAGSGSPATTSGGSGVTLNVNGKSYPINVSSTDMPLLWALRDLVGLTGTKYGCGVEICGACTVLINGQPEKSCDMSVSEAAGKQIVTVEGLAADPDGKKAQAAWIANQVPQCGYCQSGMLMSAVGAMKAGHHGSSITGEMNNLCVCGTYQRVTAAVQGL